MELTVYQLIAACFRELQGLYQDPADALVYDEIDLSDVLNVVYRRRQFQNAVVDMGARHNPDYDLKLVTALKSIGYDTEILGRMNIEEVSVTTMFAAVDMP